MTQYQRITGKVFGGNATATGDDPQIAQFGSALANTFVGTTDPEIIQQLPAWGQGWIGAVTPDTQFPPMPEMTGAMKVLSHQICGILQQGVSTWDSGTIYYTGNFCSKNGIVYVSLTDENQGNDPETDTTNWRSYGGADIDLSNLSSQGQNIANWSTNVTNCITEIPQRIKLKLQDGNLTLKAGSEVIVPNGFEADGTTPKFDYVTVQKDLSYGFLETQSGEYILICNYAGTSVGWSMLDRAGSGTSTEATTGHYYRTDLNKIYYLNNTSAAYDAFPLGIVNLVNGVPTLKQVFNGMGYIGSTVWVDKGVKCLIPNGRNEDGTLNNNEVIINKLSTVSTNDTRNAYIVISSLGIGIPTTAEWRYDEQNNYNIQNGSPKQWATVGNMSIQTGVITSFSVKQPFRAADNQETVKKSGDTMTGTLTIEADGQYTRTIVMKSKTIDISTNATQASNDGLYFVDKNGNGICWFVIQQENGTKNTTLSVGYNASQNPNFLGFNFPKATTKATTASTASICKPAVVIQNYVNGTSWYRVWSDGWIEQGGLVNANADTTTVALLKAYSNGNYTITIGDKHPGNTQDNKYINSQTNNQFSVQQLGTSYLVFFWYACGY